MRKIALPDVFNPTSDEDYLKGAIETANWIKKHEVNDENGRHWAVNCQEGKTPDEVEQTYLSNRTLYSGAAGIGFFFVQLYEVTNEVQYLEEAKAGLEFLIRTYDPELSIKPGLHTGTAGEGFLALILHEKTGEKRFFDHAVRIAKDIYEKSIKEVTNEGLRIHWKSLYDYMGDGSVVSYWIRIARLTGDDTYLSYAKISLDSILDLRVEDDEDTIHWNLINVHNYFPEVPDNGIIANFAHGTAGIVYLLTLYYDATKDEKYLHLAERGINFLEKIAVRDENSQIIPYIYLPDGDKPYDVFYLSLCHGPVGSAVVYRKLYKVTGKEKYLDGYRKFNQALINAGVPEKRSRGYWNHCICCGTSGFLLHFITEPELVPGQVNISLAARTANTILHDAYVDDNGRRWYDAWTRVKPWDVDSNLGLFVGDAGNASALLSLYAKNKGIKITTLPEFEV